MSKIVTFEQAKHLKNLGFNMDSFFAYSNEGQLESSFEMTGEFNFSKEVMDDAVENGYLNCCLAPTVSSALDWIREEKGIKCVVELDDKDVESSQYFGRYKYRGKDHIGRDCDTESFSSHPLAESALLNAVLDYLSIK